MDTLELAYIKTHDLPQKWANAILDLTGKVVSFCALGDDFQPQTTLDHFKHLAVDGKAPNAEVKTNALAELNSYLLQRHRQSLLDIRGQKELDPHQDLSEQYQSFRETCWEIVLANHEFIWRAATFNQSIMSDIGLFTTSDEIFQEMLVFIYQGLLNIDSTNYQNDTNLVTLLNKLNPGFVNELIDRADSACLTRLERIYALRYHLPIHRVKSRNVEFAENSDEEIILLASMLIYYDRIGEITFEEADIEVAVSDISMNGETTEVIRGPNYQDKLYPIKYETMLERYKHGYYTMRAILFPENIDTLSPQDHWGSASLDMDDILHIVYAEQLFTGFMEAYMVSPKTKKTKLRQRNIELFIDYHGLCGRRRLPINELISKHQVTRTRLYQIINRINRYYMVYVHRQNRKH